MLRRIWEEKWKQPSRNNPLFEGVPLAVIAAELLPDKNVESRELRQESEDFDRKMSEAVERGDDWAEVAGIKDLIL